MNQRFTGLVWAAVVVAMTLMIIAMLSLSVIRAVHGGVHGTYPWYPPCNEVDNGHSCISEGKICIKHEGKIIGCQ